MNIKPTPAKISRDRALLNVAKEVVEAPWHASLKWIVPDDDDEFKEDDEQRLIVIPTYDLADEDASSMLVEVHALTLTAEGAVHQKQRWDVLELERFLRTTLAALEADGVLDRAAELADAALDDETDLDDLDEDDDDDAVDEDEEDED